MLLHTGADVNTQGVYGDESVLTNASSSGHENIVRMLLVWGADLKEEYNRGWGRAIEAAGFNCHFNIERILLGYEVKEDTLSRYLEDSSGGTRLEKENKCRSIIYTAMRGKEADFAELIDRHRFLSEHQNTDPHNHKDDSSGSETGSNGTIRQSPPRKRARRSS